MNKRKKKSYQPNSEEKKKKPTNISSYKWKDDTVKFVFVRGIVECVFVMFND